MSKNSPKSQTLGVRQYGDSNRPTSCRCTTSSMKLPNQEVPSHTPLQSPPRPYSYLKAYSQQDTPVDSYRPVYPKLAQCCVDPYMTPQMQAMNTNMAVAPQMPVSSIDAPQQYSGYTKQPQQGTLVYDNVNPSFNPSYLSGTVQPLQQHQQRVVPQISTNTSQIMAGIGEPFMSAAPSSLNTMERCRSLKERIYDRLQRPPRPGAVATTAATNRAEDGINSPVEITKDIYEYEKPLQIATVFEVERLDGPDVKGSAGIGEEKVANYLLQKSNIGENKSDTTREVLYMATECAQIVSQLEMKLSEYQSTCTTTKEELETTKTELEAAKSTIEALTVEKDTLQRKIVDLEVTGGNEKEKYIADMKAEREKEVALSKQALTDAQTSYNSEITEVKSNLDKALVAVEEGKVERRHLEDIIANLKEQISGNTKSADTNSTNIQKLTNELLLAKQQTTFISTGYKKQDEELRELREKFRTQSEEISRLWDMEARHNDVIGERDKALAELDGSREILQEYPVLKAEADALRNTNAKLESTIDSKEYRIKELKDLVDLIRTQASAVYQQARGFNSEAAASVAKGDVMTHLGDMSSYRMDRGYNLDGPKHISDISALMHDFRMEERRIEDEKRKWHDKLDR